MLAYELFPCLLFMSSGHYRRSRCGTFIVWRHRYELIDQKWVLLNSQASAICFYLEFGKKWQDEKKKKCYWTANETFFFEITQLTVVACLHGLSFFSRSVLSLAKEKKSLESIFNFIFLSSFFLETFFIDMQATFVISFFPRHNGKIYEIRKCKSIGYTYCNEICVWQIKRSKGEFSCGSVQYRVRENRSIFWFYFFL